MKLRSLLATDAPASVLLIRVSVTLIFVSEGIQKFLFQAAFGAGRYSRIGLPMPGLMAPFVGTLQIACGLLVLAGFLTRPAALLLALDMFAATLTTKIPIIHERGFWAMAHEAPMDVAMFFSSAFLAVVGAGPRSVDARITRRGGS